jgi:uncharacterized protein GlcG (DUF336 family)
MIGDRSHLSPGGNMIRITTAAIFIAFIITSTAKAQLPTRYILTLEVAKKMAETAQTHCKELGYDVSVHVVDAAGDTLVAYRGNNTGVHTFVLSFRKAYTAMTFDRPSAVFRERIENGDMGPQLQLMLPDMAGQQGGMPIHVGKEVIGGIGVAGGGSGSDAICSQLAIDSVADQLY